MSASESGARACPTCAEKVMPTQPEMGDRKRCPICGWTF